MRSNENSDLDNNGGMEDILTENDKLNRIILERCKSIVEGNKFSFNKLK